MAPLKETDSTVRVTKQTFTYDDENKLTDARVERLGMKALTEPNVTTYHYEYDENGNRTLVEIKDDGLTLESTVYEYDRLNKMIRSREVTASGLYIYEYTYDDNGNLIQEDRHRQYELNTNQYQNIRRYEYTKDNKLECVYSGNTLLVAYTYDGDGTITSTFDRDLDLNQNLNINDRRYLNSLTNNQRQLINKVNPSDSFLYEFTEYVIDKNRPYSEILMERDGVGNLSTLYTYGNQRINSESYNNLSGLYVYDGRGSVSAVIGTWGDYRATYWYDGLGNVKSQIHGYGAFGSGKKYYGYNAESYNPVTGNQNLRNRQVNIRRQRFLTEDIFIGNKTDTLSINRYIYANCNPLRFKDPNGFMSNPYINSEQSFIAPNPNNTFIEVPDMPNGVFSFAKTTVAEYLDDIFDFEVKSGTGIGLEIDKGWIKGGLNAGAVYTTINEHGHIYQGNNDFAGEISVLNILSVGVEYNDKDGLSFALSDLKSEKYLKSNSGNIMLAIGASATNPMTGLYGGFEFGFNLTNFGRSIFDRRYRDNLYNRVISVEKKKYIEEIEKKGYFKQCQ